MKCLVINIICLSFFLNLSALAEEKKEPISFDIKSYGKANGYVNNWIPLPEIKGKTIFNDAITLKPEPGVANVIIFIASWCVKCQQIIGFIQDLEKKYDLPSIKFTYVFSHDLQEDSYGFAKEYHIKNGIVTNHKILHDYHNPDLPSIFIGDRNGWLLHRMIDVSTNDLGKLDNILHLLSAY